MFAIDELVESIPEQCFFSSSSNVTFFLSSKNDDEEAIFIDGTRIEANVIKYTFVWRKSSDNFDKKLTEKSNVLYDELVKNTIIPEIERESTKELSVTEFGLPYSKPLYKNEEHNNRKIQKNMNWEYFKATIQQLLSVL